MIDSATAIAELHPGLYDSLLAGGFSLLDMERLGEESPYSRLLSSDEAYICFGLSKSLHKGLVQIPLTGYQFTYQLFSSPVMEKPIVKTYIEFIQNYYRNHLREETNPLSEP